MSEKAVRDELTGLYNRHQFAETIHSYMAIMDAPGSPLGIMMIDVDYFKEVNDTHGHLAGDEILRSFKNIPENCLRDTDFLARYGGEEFVVLLPNTDPPTLKLVAERVRTFVATQTFDDIQKGFGVTVSIGLTHYRGRETAENFIMRADKALYQAKEEGRNRVLYIG
ncbi:MAG: GGDEF domain-containing protein [Pseudomonadales bacterium]|nr:GGDEF domain-containing protein [Pseudomonadales bacterium]